MKLKLLTVILLTILLSGCGNEELIISSAWARVGTVGGNSAIYMIIENSTGQDEILLSAKTDIASGVELHESKMTDQGTMMMEQQQSISIPSGEQVELKPGGLHIMLINLKEDLSAEESIQVSLSFINSGVLTIEVPVKQP